MTLIAVASPKSRGVTTVAELLSLLRPPAGRRCLLVDADPAGGDWLLRPGITPEPGLVSLAMAGRRRFEPGEALRHRQVVGNLEVVVGPAAAHQASAALQMVGEQLGVHLRGLTDGGEKGCAGPIDSVVDCGRLTGGSPALSTALQADLVVLVSGPTSAALVHLAPLVELVRAAGRAPAILLFGSDGRGARYDAVEVAAGMGAEVLGTMGEDPAAAARLFEEPGVVDRLGRSRLGKSMTPVVARAWALAEANEAATAATPPPAALPPAYESYAPIGWRDPRDG